MEKKLEIIGPYTPDHPGPFCTRREVPVDLKYREGRASISSLANAKPAAAASQGTDGEGHAQ